MKNLDLISLAAGGTIAATGLHWVGNSLAQLFLPVFLVESTVSWLITIIAFTSAGYSIYLAAAHQGTELEKLGKIFVVVLIGFALTWLLLLLPFGFAN